MDYVVGSVAALISGNVTPNRPKLLKRALTPMKNQPSPNVTPKSELVSDRSIFLSPTAQKKKAIIKKSPKRIFENPDLDVTSENDENSVIMSPKADKVKKHLKDDLNANIDLNNTILSPKSSKNKLTKLVGSPSSKKSMNLDESDNMTQNIQIHNDSTPKKKKKKRETANVDDSEGNKTADEENNSNLIIEGENEDKTSHKKRKKANQFTVETITPHTQTPSIDQVTNTETTEKVITKKNKKKLKKLINKTIQSDTPEVDKNQSTSVNTDNEGQIKKKKTKKHKKNTKDAAEVESNRDDKDNIKTVTENTKASPFINPNAITNQDTDSEHESDNEIQSDNDEANKTVLNTGPEESSDEEEEEEEQKPKKKIEKDSSNKKGREEREESEEEVKRTLFVGNVPFSNKCKKEIKRIFSKYGDIETVRIRTVPVKDARVTPKLAVIKNELHPDRSTVNVYIKYKQSSSVDEALAENNTVLNGHHLRVARSNVTGSEHDPKCSVFVGNIPFALEDEGLRAKFEKCGQIESVRIIRDRKTNAGKGFGYVNFASKDGVELALALSDEDLTIKNRILRVKRCTQLTANRQQTKRNVQGKQNNYHQSKNYNQRGDGGSFQMNRPRNQYGNNRFQRQDQQSTDGKNEGAYRRIMNKRKPQDGNDGPPNKRQRDATQPNREKKTRKEFVGLTAAKKKFQKKKMNKGEKKNKVISEILTKARH